MLAKGLHFVLFPERVLGAPTDITYSMIASKSAFESQRSEPLPNSSRVYVNGKIHPDVRVPLRENQLSPSRQANNRAEVNEAVAVYDCSGPWGDPVFQGEVEQGLPALREPWIL